MTVISSEKLAEQNGAANTLLWMLRIIYLLGSGLILAALFFYIKEKDKKHMAEMREKLEKKVREKEQRLSEITVREYSFQIIVNLDTMECRQEIYRKEAGDIHEFECGSYMEGFQEFCRKVEKNDRGRVTEHLAPDNLARMSDEETLPSFDYRLAEDSQTYWYECIIFYSVTGDKRYAYIMNKDVTQKVRIQRKLEEANQAKGRFLANMSHDIRTPLNAIIGTAQLAERSLEKPEKLRQYMSTITGAAKHLLSLINDVLDMSKIEEGMMKISHEPFNLETVVEAITSMIYPQAAAKGLTFTVPLIDITDTSLIGDPLRLNQVLINLLSNALKFTPEGGAVSLEIRQTQRMERRARLRFTVSDTGIGMSESFLNHIFTPFEQESAATGQKFGGTGLGMPITKNLVILMGGVISVRSKAGQGTTFTVEIDFDVPEDGNGTRPQKQQALENLKVLISDDDRDNCIHTSLMLKNMGIISDWVQTGEECVEKVREAHSTGGDYDVCFVDWKMPDIDGLEVIRHIRDIVGPATTIIVVTAYDWSSIEKSARDAGADAFLTKPVFASTLYNTLLSVTGIEKVIMIPEAGQDLNLTQLSGHRLLLVEDNELNREIAIELLKMTGITVDYAVNGKEALDKFLECGDIYDMILMDVQMPVMDGYQATEEIRKSGHPRAAVIPIIAMTADAFHEDVARASEAGMDGHLAKPIDPKLLYQTILETVKAH